MLALEINTLYQKNVQLRKDDKPQQNKSYENKPTALFSHFKFIFFV